MIWPATEAAPDGHRADLEQPQGRGHGADHQRPAPARQKTTTTSAPAGVEVAEGHDQDQAGGVADLGAGDDQGGGGRADVEGAGHLCSSGWA